MTDNTTTPHYVDNKRFQELLVQRKELILNCKPTQRIDNEIGDNILKIAYNLSYRRNFINYTFREEMIGDAIENCIRYIDNYDEVKYSNPFAYFTQMCFYAFVRRITREDKDAKGRLSLYEKQSTELGATDKLDFQFAVIDDLMRE